MGVVVVPDNKHLITIAPLSQNDTSGGQDQQRMDYGRYRACGWPIGSRSVEGQCMFVVGRRFKGNGMRWRPHDNECVLRTRLAVLNGELDRYFQPRSEFWNEAA